jgi:Tfp pilus assembly protein PilX
MLRFEPGRQKGMALISVLLFLLIFSLLSLTAIESNIVERKIYYANWRKQQMVTAGQQIMAQISQQVPSHCMIKPTPVSQLLAQSFTSWQHSSCVGNMQAFLYYYVIEPLGSDACGQLLNANADYYRITLLLVDAQHITVKTVMQNTVAQPAPVRQECKSTIRMMTGGVQTTRILL